MSCDVYCDYELKGKAIPQSIFKIELRKGTYIIEFKQNEDVIYSLDYSMHSNDEEDLLRISTIEYQKKIDREQKYKQIEHLDVSLNLVEGEDISKWKWTLKNNCDGTSTQINYLVGGDQKFDACGLLKVNIGGKVDEEGWFWHPYYLFITGGKWGCINKLGEVQIPIIYDSGIYFNDSNVTIAKLGENILFINKWNEIVFENPYDEVENDNSAFENGLCIVKKDGLWGIIDAKGAIKLALCHSEIIRHNTTFSIKKDEKWGLVDHQCLPITPIMYDSLHFCYHYYIAEICNHFGLINDKGIVVIPMDYNEIKGENGHFILCKNKKYGIIDGVYCKEITPIDYDEIKEEYSNFILCKNKKYGIIDGRSCKEIIPIDYDEIKKEEGCYFILCKNKKYGIIDGRSCKEIIPIDYDEIKKEDSYFILCKNKKYGIIVGGNCKEIIPIDYDEIKKEGSYFILCKNKKYGIIDIDGVYCKEIIPIDYDEIKKEDRYFILCKNKKYGIIDGRSCKEIIPIDYDEIKSLEDNYYLTRNGQWWDYIEIFDEYNGNILLNKLYQIYPSNQDFFLGGSLVKRNGKWGCLNKNLLNIKKCGFIKERIPCEYDKIADIRKNFILNPCDNDYSIKFFVKEDEHGNLHYYEYQIDENKDTARIIFEWTEPKDNTYYLFFDTETTGIPLDYNAPSSDIKNWPRLIQLGWILMNENGKKISEKSYIVKPDGFSIPTNAAKIHKITTKVAMEKGHNLSFVIDEFIEDFNKSKYIVGHNIDFDKKIIGAELIRLSKQDVMNNKETFCTMKLSVNFCKIFGKTDYKYPTLQELYKKLFGSDYGEAHNALSDTEATQQCFWEMKKRKLI